MPTSSEHATSASPPPLPVRLVDMRALEDRYLAASPEERMAIHGALAYFELITDEERFALERRFPFELEGDPLAADASEGVRVSWDLRSRELVVCMLQYGERALAAVQMDLVRTVAPTENVAVFAMTATGSFLELGCPLPDGSRHYVYSASTRPGGVREEGVVMLKEPLLLGNRVSLGRRRTMELLFLAAGPELPPYDETVPGTLLHGPVEDAPAPPMSDPMRVGMTRFRVLVDSEKNAPAALRHSFQQQAASLAAELQGAASPAGGLRLSEVASFSTDSGSRHDVEDLGNMLDIARHPSDGQEVLWLRDVDIGDQRVTEGAPLVIFHEAPEGVRGVAYVFRVAHVEPRRHAG